MSSPHTGGQRVEVGRTEHLKNQKNPDFAKGFEVEYVSIALPLVKCGVATPPQPNNVAPLHSHA